MNKNIYITYKRKEEIERQALRPFKLNWTTYISDAKDINTFLDEFGFSRNYIKDNTLCGLSVSVTCTEPVGNWIADVYYVEVLRQDKKMKDIDQIVYIETISEEMQFDYSLGQLLHSGFGPGRRFSEVDFVFNSGEINATLGVHGLSRLVDGTNRASSYEFSRNIFLDYLG